MPSISHAKMKLLDSAVNMFLIMSKCESVVK